METGLAVISLRHMNSLALYNSESCACNYVVIHLGKSLEFIENEAVS